MVDGSVGSTERGGIPVGGGDRVEVGGVGRVGEGLALAGGS